VFSLCDSLFAMYCTYIRTLAQYEIKPLTLNTESQVMCYSALANRRHRIFLSIHAEQTSSDLSKTQNLSVNFVH